MNSPPANWYPDPEHPGYERYWNGTLWTDDRRATAAAAPAPAPMHAPSAPSAQFAAHPGVHPGVQPGVHPGAHPSLQPAYVPGPGAAHHDESTGLKLAGIACTVLAALLSVGSVALDVNFASTTGGPDAAQNPGYYFGAFCAPFIMAAIVRGIYSAIRKRRFMSGWLGVACLVFAVLTLIGQLPGLAAAA